MAGSDTAETEDTSSCITLMLIRYQDIGRFFSALSKSMMSFLQVGTKPLANWPVCFCSPYELCYCYSDWNSRSSEIQLMLEPDSELWSSPFLGISWGSGTCIPPVLELACLNTAGSSWLIRYIFWRVSLSSATAITISVRDYTLVPKPLESTLHASSCMHMKSFSFHVLANAT